MDPVPVVLEVEIELAVGVRERVRIDASAELGLADHRLGAVVDEWPERIARDRDADALRIPANVARGVIEQIFAAEPEHFGRPGEACLAQLPSFGSASRLLSRSLRVAREAPVHEVGR